MNDAMIELRDAVAQLSESIAIAHHIPGRIRFRIGMSGTRQIRNLADTARHFVRILEKNGGSAIRSVTLNPLALSCVIEYDAGVIPPSAWQDLLCGTGGEAADRLLRSLEDAFRGARPLATD
ncbi:MAG: cation transporter [Telmatospirillum sp.]|nr:cation transporter [Telmatospirillum sp.]